MNFSVSFCDPFNPKIVELGEIDADKIIETFDKIPWRDYLEKMINAEDREIHYSPSLAVENKEQNCGLDISFIEENDWYIFFKRPKRVKWLFGLISTMQKSYLTDITKQTEKDVRDCLQALIRNDLDFLENKIK